MARLGNLIKARRERMGLSLRDFAEECRLSHSYIKNLEDGDPRTGKEITPTLSSLEKIAPVFGMSVEDLLVEIGFIQNQGKEFVPGNLLLLRGDKSYKEICQEISEKTGENVDPAVYEAIEKGHDDNPSVLFVDLLAQYAGVDRSFFYQKNTVEMLEEAKRKFPYKYEKAGDFSHYINEDLKEFVIDPENNEYLKLAKELKENNVKVNHVRGILLKNKI